MKKHKIQAKWRIFKRKMLNAFLLISVILAVLFLLSPLFMNFPWFSDRVAWFFEPLKTSEYKGAFIGACGGMIGSFLAITGALWVERRLVKDNEQQEIAKTALILYYDMKMFYHEATLLAISINRILETHDKDQKEQLFTLYKNQTGVHVHPDWISLVASLTGILRQDEIEQIYSFFGYISDMKTILDENHDKYFESGNMGRINHIIYTLGKIDRDQYLPNQTYTSILDKLMAIASCKVSAQ